MPLSPARWNIHRSDIVHETIDGEVVVIDMSTGSYYSLDAVGADVWALIETGTTTDGIVQSINQRYDGDRSEMERAVVYLIDELRQEGLIAADEMRAEEQIAALEERDDAGSEKRRFEAPILRKYTDMEELIMLDPIHQVDDTGWPNRKPEHAPAD